MILIYRINPFHSNDIHSFIHQCLYSPLFGPGLFFSVVILFAHTVGLCLDEWSGHRKAATYTQDNINTDIHALSGIRTHDPSVQAREDSLCIRPHGHCDRPFWRYTSFKKRPSFQETSFNIRLSVTGNLWYHFRSGVSELPLAVMKTSKGGISTYERN
jgi:hypothetical protein